MYVIITGASRGIGLELTRQALMRDHHVLAIARKPLDSVDLMELKENYSKLEILSLDLSVNDAGAQILNAVKSWPCLDVIINNAGIYLEDDSQENFEKSFLINSIKPLFITKSLLPKLKDSRRPLNLAISSMMGSITDNHSGGSYSYRSSKCALNMIYRCLSIDESWLISLVVHPGWVKTRMGGDSAPLEPKESAEGIWKIVETASLAQSGSFLQYQGMTLPW